VIKCVPIFLNLPTCRLCRRINNAPQSAADLPTCRLCRRIKNAPQSAADLPTCRPADLPIEAYMDFPGGIPAPQT